MILSQKAITMSQVAHRWTRRALATGCGIAALVAGPMTTSVAASSSGPVPADISVVSLSSTSEENLALNVRYRCMPGRTAQVVGIYGSRPFAWVGHDELYGQEESRLFDLPCTGRYEKATVSLVTYGPLPEVGHVHAGIGVSDPADWSFEVANDSKQFRHP